MAMNPNGPLLQGRWLWYGNEGRNYNNGNDFGAWDHHLAQASAWGMTGVHIKMANGTSKWYSPTQYDIFKMLGKKHNLQISPMHYCYGGANLYTEAAIEAELGNAFGSVVPDMEDEWFNQTGWADAFGIAIRKSGYAGPIFPSVYANTSYHPFPYVQCNRWAAGFLPQVYFVEWSDTQHGWWGAQQAVNYVYKQWLDLDARCKAETHIGLKPMLPDIQVGPADHHPEHVLSTNEVHNWLVMMQGYGYCGFWYEEVYEPYAAVVKASPFPQVKQIVAAPAQQHPAHQQQSSPPSPVVVVAPHSPAPSVSSPPSHPIVASPSPPATVVPPPRPVSPPAPQVQPSLPVLQKPPELVPIGGDPLGSSAIEETPTAHVPVPPAISSPPSSPSSPPSGSSLLEVLANKQSTSPSSSVGVLSTTSVVVTPSVRETEPTATAVGRDMTSTDPSLSLVPSTPPTQEEEAQKEMGAAAAVAVEEEPEPPRFPGGSSSPLISEKELEAMWHWEVASLEWDSSEPITARWITLLEEGVSSHPLGAPLHAPQQKVVDGVTVSYITFRSGCQIIHFPDDPVARVI